MRREPSSEVSSLPEQVEQCSGYRHGNDNHNQKESGVRSNFSLLGTQVRRSHRSYRTIGFWSQCPRLPLIEGILYEDST